MKTEQRLTPQHHPSRRGGRFLGVLIVVVALGAVFWVLRSTSNLFNHIMPSAGVARSSSMQPYEIVLRTKVWDERAKKLTDHFYEWKLAVPRTYLIDESGDNGAVREGERMELGYYDATLELLVGAEDDSVSSTIELKPSRNDDNTIQIGLINREASRELVEADLCRKTKTRCYIQSKRCGIQMQMDGWSVGMAPTLGLYEQPEKVCTIVKKFLNTYTIKRDQLPPTL